ncbi:MAG: DUF1648 domain-containing protein [Dehalococcoidales bacterium]|nr:DUF1648 domain-containing protein [Dehalococcoidales bacterium]
MTRPEDSKNGIKSSFPFRLIVLPFGLVVISAVLAAVFYPELPARLAYHFHNGLPDRWLGKEVFITVMVLAQAFFALLAFIAVRVVLLATGYLQAPGVLTGKLLAVMSQVVIIPQLIIVFTMLDSFLYNAYRVKLIPVWVFAVTVMAIGGVFLAVFFSRIIHEARQQHSGTRKES